MKKYYLTYSLLVLLLLTFAKGGYSQTYQIGNSVVVGGWYKIGTLTLPQQGADAELKILAGNGYNAVVGQQGECDIHFRTSNASSQNGGFYGSGSFYSTGRTKIINGIRVVQNSLSSWDFYANLTGYTGYGSTLNLISSLGTWTSNFVLSTPPSTGIAFFDLIEESLQLSNVYLMGNVGVGTVNTSGYKLAVNGSAIATSMTVKLVANWPDYVFESSYHLSPLKDVKSYIDRYHHLPEIPSEQELKEKGLDLGEMNKQLVKKVEELTLYMIEKDQQIKDQQHINHNLEERLNILEQNNSRSN